MPTLPIAKTAEAGQETTGGQRHLSLPRLRVSLQPAAVAAVSAPQHGHGIWIPGRNSLADARPLVLRQAQDEWELPKDGKGSGQRRDSKKLPQDGADDLRGPESRETEGRPAPPLPSPVAFAREVLGVQLWAKQEEVLTALTTHRRVAVKAGNGLGKGFCAAVAVLWFIHTHQNAAVALTTGELPLYPRAPTLPRPVASQERPLKYPERPGDQAERPQPTVKRKEAKGQGPRHLYQVPA